MKAVLRMAVSIAVLLLPPGVSAATPMRVALLVDTSAATATALPQIRTAVSAFLDALPAEHEALLVTTGRHAQVRVPPTVDRNKLKGSVNNLLTDNGPTALMDALTEVDQRFMRKAADRWAVFVILTGDGSENSKQVDAEEFNRWMSELPRRRVSVSAIVLKTSVNSLPELIASTLATATHGHYATMGNGGGMARTLTQFAAQLSEEAAVRGR